MQQDDHLLSSLGFGSVRSPPAGNPNSPQNGRSSFSPMCDISPQSYNSPSPTGSSKRGAEDDIYIEHQVLKKACYSPPAFHSLPASSAQNKDAATSNASAICEKNKMLASLLATQPTTPATIPPLPQSVITATPQERLPKIPGRTRQNSTGKYINLTLSRFKFYHGKLRILFKFRVIFFVLAMWSGGTIKLNEPLSPPVVTPPKMDEYLPPVTTGASLLLSKETYPRITPPASTGSLVQHPKETYPGINQPVSALDQHPKETYPVITPPVTTGTLVQRPKESYPVIPPPVATGSLGLHPKETYPALPKAPSPISLPSSPESENGYPIPHPRNQVSLRPFNRITRIFILA